MDRSEHNIMLRNMYCLQNLFFLSEFLTFNDYQNVMASHPIVVEMFQSEVVALPSLPLIWQCVAKNVTF